VADGLGLGRAAAMAVLTLLVIASRMVLQGVREPAPGEAPEGS
jgi:hypothetical protein